MPQRAIPFLFMRGGTSRGPYFNRSDLPEDRQELAELLCDVLGAGHPLNIDGIGGGAAVTTKVAMLSPSDDAWADIDYFFAQVAVEERLVDFKPTCGNILAGVGPAAIEMGLIAARDGETLVRIRSVNTGALVEAKVQTPEGVVLYEGDCAIDGVPGSAAPVPLSFMKVAGSNTGSMLPTGNVSDLIDGIEVTCIDVAMPLMIARASDFGVTGAETREELDANADLIRRLEAVRVKAGERMGMGDVSKSVTPKIGLLAEPKGDGAITARYFMPWACHPTMAVTGAQCIASCLLCPGTVARDLARLPNGSPAKIVIEHPSGTIEVLVDYQSTSDGRITVESAGLLRTARLLARGELMAPGV
ncbi:MAG: 4-oxalomesaconate tautomerase [Pseudomonadota bacterium]